MSLCLRCKGRGLCGRPKCPILQRFKEMAHLPKLGKSLEGYSPPEVFVGRYGYPRVSAGPLIPLQKDVEIHRSPSDWLKMDVGKVVTLRSSVVRSGTEVEVKDANNPGKMLQKAQEIAMSSTPVGTEVTFFKPPKGHLRFDGLLMPMGPRGKVKDLDLTTNPAVPRKVDQIVEEKEMKASQAIGELYISGVDVVDISRLLSLGLLGKQKKLVPTRWSITASDDMAGKLLTKEVLDFPLVNDYLLYSGEKLGNHFEILIMPGVYNFELIEIWLPRSIWSGEDTWIDADNEGPEGKKTYSNLMGGYYAARLALLERLISERRQGTVLMVREISEEYWAPLGVWVVREAARSALSRIPQRFNTLGEALDEMNKRLRTPLHKWTVKSQIITGTTQTSFASFF